MEQKNMSNEMNENVGEMLGTTGRWVEEHSSILVWSVLGILAVVLGALSLYNFIVVPNSLEASNENARSVVYFLEGNYEKALNGDDEECVGFESTANNYRFYQSGKLAALYAGLCFYQLGDYENAIEYVKRYSSDDLVVGYLAYQMLGDLYVEVGDYKRALKAYRKTFKSDDELIAPQSLKKAGLVYLELGDKENAKKLFEAIKNNYSHSIEAQDVDKFIAISVN